MSNQLEDEPSFSIEQLQNSVANINEGAGKGMKALGAGVFVSLLFAIFAAGLIAKVAIGTAVLCAMLWVWVTLDQVCSHWLLVVLQCRRQIFERDDASEEA